MQIFKKLVSVLLATVLYSGVAIAQGAEAPKFVEGDSWTYNEGINTFTETVVRVEGSTASVRRVTVSQSGAKSELSLVYEQGIRQGPVNFRNFLQFPLEVGKEWKGTWSNSNASGSFTTQVLKKEMIQVAGGSYEGYWLRYSSYGNGGGSLILNYAYVPELKRIVETVQTQSTDPAKLRKFTVTNSAGVVIKGVDPKFDDKFAAN